MQHPVSWQPSADGTKFIGHMILKKSLKDGPGPSSSATILGLKVVGGKLLPNNTYGAIIEKVKKGSIADTVGHLLPGKIYFISVSFLKLKNAGPGRPLCHLIILSGLWVIIPYTTFHLLHYLF